MNQQSDRPESAGKGGAAGVGAVILAALAGLARHGGDDLARGVCAIGRQAGRLGDDLVRGLSGTSHVPGLAGQGDDLARGLAGASHVPDFAGPADDLTRGLPALPESPSLIGQGDDLARGLPHPPVFPIRGWPLAERRPRPVRGP